MISETYSEFVPNVHFELIPIKDLVSNQNYQRELSTRHVNKNAAEFDLYQINPVKVSRRDGVNYVFDGQHTIEVIAKVSESRETPVWCMIYDDLTYEVEADIFANQKKGTKNLLPFEIFNANVEAGNQTQLTIKALVESYGLRIGSAQVDSCICAVSALEFIYTKYGYHTLDKALMILVATWEGDKYSLSANFIKGIARLVETYGERLKPEMFAEKLSLFSPKDVIRTARERRNGSLGYAEAMLTFYNRKLKSGLKWNMLYDENDDEEELEQEEAEQQTEGNESAEEQEGGEASGEQQEQLSMEDIKKTV